MELTNTEPTLDIHSPERAVFVTDDNRRARRLRRGASWPPRLPVSGSSGSGSECSGSAACPASRSASNGQRRRRRSAAGAQSGQAFSGRTLARSPRAGCHAKPSESARARLAVSQRQGSGTARAERSKPPVSIPPPVSNPAPPRPAARQPGRAPARLGSQGLPGPAGAGEEDATAPPPPPSSRGQHRGQTETTTKPPPPGQAKKTPPPPPPPEG